MKKILATIVNNTDSFPVTPVSVVDSMSVEHFKNELRAYLNANKESPLNVNPSDYSVVLVVLDYSDLSKVEHSSFLLADIFPSEV